MRPILAACVVMGCGLLTAQPAWADLLRLKDGSQLRGKIIKRTTTELIVQLDFGTMSFTPDEIVSVEEEVPEQPPTRSRASEDLEVPVRHIHDEAGGLRARRAEASSGAAEGVHPRASPPAQVTEGRAGAEERRKDLTLPEAMRAIAFVGALYEDGSIGIGSGTIVSHKGILVTNYHVVEHAKEIKVVLPSEEAKISLPRARPYQARVLKTDECYDLALLRIPVSTPAHLRFAADDDIHVGEEVRAVGNPEGLTVSVSKGVISAVRTVREMGLEEVVEAAATECQHLSGRVLGNFTLVQTDASINPGNSGGPLLNTKHEIVGINTLIAGIGLNFAIHAKHARTFVGTYAKE